MPSNFKWYNLVYNQYANFRAVAPKLLESEWSTKGVTALKTIPKLLDTFLELSYTWVTKQIYAAGYDTIFYQYATKWPGSVGEYVRIINVRGNKPAERPYLNLQNGDSVDQQRVRKNVTDEYFFEYNCGYYNTYTLFEDWQYEKVLDGEYGVSMLLPAIAKAQGAQYANWQDACALKALNDGFHDPKKPMKASQKIYLGAMPANGFYDDDYLNNFVAKVRAAVTTMTKSVSGKFNAYGFEYRQPAESLLLVTRLGIEDALAMRKMTSAKSNEPLGLNVELVETPNMGDLVAYASEESTDPLYPVFGAKFHEIVGYATTENATTPEYSDTEDEKLNPNKLPVVVWKPTQSLEVARIYDRNALKVAGSTGRQIRFSPHNEAGLYQVVHEHEPKVGYWFDQRYNYISIYASAAPVAVAASKTRAKKAS